MARKIVAASSMALTGSDSGFPSGSADRTLVAWVRSSTGGVTQSILGYGTGTTGNGLALYISTSNQLSASNFGGSVTVAGDDLHDGNWHLCVLTLNAGTWGVEVRDPAGGGVSNSGAL